MKNSSIQDEFYSKQSMWAETPIPMVWKEKVSLSGQTSQEVKGDLFALRLYRWSGWFYWFECRGLYQSTITGCCSRKTLIRTQIDFFGGKKRGEWCLSCTDIHPGHFFQFLFLVGHLKVFHTLWPKSFHTTTRPIRKLHINELLWSCPLVFIHFPCFYPFLYLFLNKMCLLGTRIFFFFFKWSVVKSIQRPSTTRNGALLILVCDDAGATRVFSSPQWLVSEGCV